MLVIDEPAVAIQEVGVVEHDLARINSIETRYKDWRKKSKAPTFALTYQGTTNTLINNCGFSKEVAQQVYDSYHRLYHVSTAWVNERLDKAAEDGYVIGAFGLKVRTPLMANSNWKGGKISSTVAAESRTAGNALGQSWCLLNSRAWSACMKKVRSSKFRTDIRLCAQIHDAGYTLVRNDIAALLFLNDAIVPEVEWNDHPDIYHPEVGLGGELSVFYPTWEYEVGIPNYATEEILLEAVETGLAEVAKKMAKAKESK